MKPREKMLAHGPSTLSDSELIAVLIGTGTPTWSVHELSHHLLQRAGGLQRLAQSSVALTCQTPGIGPTKACRLFACFELGRRAFSTFPSPDQPLTGSAQVVEMLRPRCASLPHEELFVIPMDARCRPLGLRQIARGGLTECAAAPRDVFRALVLESCAQAIIAHNHPSGDPEPSPEDVAFTARLAEAGFTLGIPIIDHIIIGNGSYFSFADEGLLST